MKYLYDSYKQLYQKYIVLMMLPKIHWLNFILNYTLYQWKYLSIKVPPIISINSNIVNKRIPRYSMKLFMHKIWDRKSSV